MKKKMLIVGMAVPLLCSALFAGCGKEQVSEMTKEAQEDTGYSEETESAPDSTDVSESYAEEPSKSFTFNPDKAFSQPTAVTEEGKIVLTLQDSMASQWLIDSVNGFNRQSDTYYIRLLESGTGEPLAACRDKMSVEIVAGKGPDLFTGDVLSINETMIEKGYIEDLAPKLEEFEITDEEYFPSVRAFVLGDGVYAVCPFAEPEGFWVLESVLGSREQPDIKTLVDKLYEYPDQDAAWRKYASATQILEYFLMGSEDLWGMIDWDEKTCDFSGELFTRMLEVVERYKNTDGNNENVVSGWYDPFYEQKPSENEGKVLIDYLFDDGCYPYYRRSYSLMVNANSQHKEGAWEFLKYLFGEEGQNYVANGAPSAANKEMFQSYAEWEMKMIEEGRMQAINPMTEKVVEDICDYAERARYTPTRTNPILSIIYEEAGSYFAGDKPIEEVIDLIQNRVQVYLNEMT